MCKIFQQSHPSFLSGTSGLTCGTVDQASFSGSGSLELPPLAAYIVDTGGQRRRRRAITQMLVILQFVTTIPSGVLFYNEGGKFGQLHWIEWWVGYVQHV